MVDGGAVGGLSFFVPRVVDTLRLIRMGNCVMSMAGVLLGAALMGGTMPVLLPVLAGISAFFVCAAGNTTNDLLDVPIDRVVHPHRVLVREALSRRYAVVLAVVCYGVAIFAAAMVNWAVVLVVVAAINLLLAYNLRLKRIPLVGNMVVGVLGGLTLVTGGLAVEPARVLHLPGPLIGAVLALLFHLVREIVKDVQDVDGDRPARVLTIPQMIGVRSSLYLATGLFCLLAVLALVPVWSGWFGTWYAVIAIFIIDLPLLSVLLVVCLNPSRRRLRAGSWSLKAGMAAGVVALLVA